jgi:phosphopantothenoylcysteine decarboxylase/phosphopantothenate--cysteine ligase
MTNFSTGRLGVTLSRFLSDAGHRVVCLKGEGAVFPGPTGSIRTERFGTNDELLELLGTLSREIAFDAVLHAAALCDYRVEAAHGDSGERIRSAKFATRDGRLHLVLAPATKVLPHLRHLFPEACLIGWKYELVGSPEDAFARAWRQIRECDTDACVLNGAAYGEGFAVCHRGGRVDPCPDLPTLCTALLGSLMEYGARRSVPAMAFGTV